MPGPADRVIIPYTRFLEFLERRRRLASDRTGPQSHDRIIVDRLDDGEQQIGRIIIPDSAKEKPQRGTVVAAGNGRVAKYSGKEIRLDGKDLFILKEDDILAVIDNPKKQKAKTMETTLDVTTEAIVSERAN